MAVLSSFSADWVGIPGSVSVWVNYRTANLRILDVEWDNQCGRNVRARVWNSGVLVYDEVKGPGIGSETVPGNHTLIEVNDPEIGDYLELPDYLSWQFEVL